MSSLELHKIRQVVDPHNKDESENSADLTIDFKTLIPTPEPSYSQNFELSISQELIELHELFNRYGYNLWGVGGAPRDLAMGLDHSQIKDIDLITDAPPHVKEQLLKHGGWEIIVLKAQQANGIHVATKNGQEYEIATLRLDSGERHTNKFTCTTSLTRDLLRRDFEINTLVMGLERASEGVITVSDYVGVLPELQNKQLKTLETVGAATQRFAEDRSRIIRAISQSCRFGLELSPEIQDSLALDNRLSVLNAEGKRSDGMSVPQIRVLFLKGLGTAPHVFEYLTRLEQYGLLSQILPNLKSDLLALQHLPTHTKLIPSVALATILRNENSAVLSHKLFSLCYSKSEIAQITFLNKLFGLTNQNAYELKSEYAIVKTTSDKNQPPMNLSHVHDFFEINNLTSPVYKAFMEYLTLPPIGRNGRLTFLESIGAYEEGLTDNQIQNLIAKNNQAFRDFVRKTEQKTFDELCERMSSASRNNQSTLIENI